MVSKGYLVLLVLQVKMVCRDFQDALDLMDNQEALGYLELWVSQVLMEFKAVLV